MGVPVAEQNRLYARSGNRCAFKNCGRILVDRQGPGEPLVLLGNVCHIVARSPGGPRADVFIPPHEIDRYDNLILLCNTHHQLVDFQPHTFTSDRLKAIKEEHESWVEQRLGSGPSIAVLEPEPREDTLYATALPVQQMPERIYAATSDFRTEHEVKARLAPARRGEMLPFILREGKLFAFHPVRAKAGPFAPVTRGPQESHRFGEWARDPDRAPWLAALLNRSLNKLTGRLGLALDMEHHRYFFPMVEPGEPVSVSYRPLNAKQAERSVVWQPVSKRLGTARNFWYHRAVALRFAEVGPDRWILTLRPELRVTTDGSQPLPSTTIGSKVTRKKARLYNYDLLSEIQFWRDFLSRSTPRLLFPFGNRAQRIVVSTDLLSGVIQWPGIPSQHQRPFRNVNYVDDLFTWAEVDGPETEEDAGWDVADVEGEG